VLVLANKQKVLHAGLFMQYNQQSIITDSAVIATFVVAVDASGWASLSFALQ
jgi:hypothetical protein